MFDENARGALIQHLGYVPQPEEEAPVETEKPAVDSSITAEDLFAGASPSTPESPSLRAKSPRRARRRTRRRGAARSRTAS